MLLSITWNASQFYATQAVISFRGQVSYPTSENFIVSFWVLSLLVWAHFFLCNFEKVYVKFFIACIQSFIHHNSLFLCAPGFSDVNASVHFVF